MTVSTIRPDLPSYDDHDGVPSLQVCHQARISYRQLDFWTRGGRLHPNENAPGSGHIRTYPRHEVAVATLMGRLTRAGLDVTHAEQAARELLATGATRLAGIRLELPEQL